MSNLPKFLGFSFKNPEFKQETLAKIKEKIIGEEPTEFVEELDGKQREVFLISEENTRNKDLYELLIENKADIFTCRFDLTQEEAEFEEVTPFVYQEAPKSSDSSKEVPAANDDVLSKLDFALETDIFKFVDDSQSNELFGEFEKEQSAINLEYSRLGKDILEYRNSDLTGLAKKVSDSLIETEIFQKLEKSKEGVENLKYNQKEELEELDSDFETIKLDLSKRLATATLDNDLKAKAIIEHELQEGNKNYQKKRSNLITKNAEILEKNIEAVNKLKKDLNDSIIDIADGFVDYDLKRLYKYELRYNQARDLVREYFSVDRTKEREQQELRAKRLAESLSESASLSLSESTSISQSVIESESTSLSLIQSSVSASSESIQKSEQASARSYLEDLIQSPAPDSQNIDSSVAVESEPHSLSEQLAAKLGGGTQLPKTIDKQEEPQTSSSNTSKNVEEVEDLTINDTIQFKDSESNQIEEKNLEMSETNVKNNAAFKNSVVMYIKKYKWAVLSGVAGIMIVGAIGTLLINSGNKNQNAQLAQSSSTSSSFKDKKENVSGVSSKSKEDELDVTLSNKEYQKNIKILVAANIGMYLDDNDELTGTMKVKKEDGSTSLRYIIEYKRNGTLVVKDKEGAVSTYDKEWVDNLIQTLSKKGEANE